MKLINKINTFIIYSIKKIFSEWKYKAIAKTYNLNGFQRVYLIHIRKTGGTSLNNMFLALSKDSKQLYNDLTKTIGHRIICNNFIYVGWDKKNIEKGNYFYGFSHIPLYKLQLPKNTFTVSCFRDPAERVISHYNMLIDYKKNNINHPCMAIEGQWLGDSFEDFIERIPQEHLLNQLYMFSSNFCIDEAMRSIKTLSYYFFNDDFEEGIKDINRITGLNLEQLHIRKSAHKTIISEQTLIRLKEKLSKEYQLLELLRNHKKKGNT
jgi:hypothetical protein